MPITTILWCGIIYFQINREQKADKDKYDHASYDKIDTLASQKQLEEQRYVHTAHKRHNYNLLLIP